MKHQATDRKRAGEAANQGVVRFVLVLVLVLVLESPANQPPKEV